MDTERFDRLTRYLTPAGSRRRALVAALSGALSLTLEASSVEEVGAKKKNCPSCKKRNKQGKCKKKKPDGTACATGTCQGGRCLAPTCSDGFKNGSETGIDCGGNCARCANGQSCATHIDCVGAFCSGGTCQECVVGSACGFDGSGDCYCVTPETGGANVCIRPSAGGTVPDCESCPDGTICSRTGPHLFCSKTCGAP